MYESNNSNNKRNSNNIDNDNNNNNYKNMRVYIKLKRTLLRHLLSFKC